jgi:ubiquinone/menaquinone biosynthesis C-methylase UbiE
MERVRQAYTSRAAEYGELFGLIETAAVVDRDLVVGWALAVDGPVLDVGCGPGHWTGFLADHGVNIEGIDPVPVFVDEAQRRHPDCSFRLGRAEALDVGDASLGGVLAWHSLTHTDPNSIDHALTEFARCIAPGGGVVVGFFEGPLLEAFEHAVTTAYYRPIDLLAARIARAGFVVVETHARTDPGARRQGSIIAQRHA